MPSARERSSKFIAAAPKPPPRTQMRRRLLRIRAMTRFRSEWDAKQRIASVRSSDPNPAPKPTEAPPSSPDDEAPPFPAGPDRTDGEENAAREAVESWADELLD